MTDLENYFSTYISKLLPSGKKYKISLEFYPYRSTFIKIYRRERKITIRFNDRLKDAPSEVLKAGGREMIHRLAGKRALATDKVIFRQHINQLPVIIKPSRIRKIDGSPIGNQIDLKPIYDFVNEQYFKGVLKINGVYWTNQIVKSYYANYSLGHGMISINRAFDHSEVPGYILEYLMYHEALHSVFPPRMINGRYVKHTREFRRNEKSFIHYKKSKEWLKKNGNTFIRKNGLLKKIAN